MGDEKEDVILKSVLWLQEQQDALSDGFTVRYKDQDYFFVPKFISRHDKKMDRLLTGTYS